MHALLPFFSPPHLYIRTHARIYRVGQIYTDQHNGLSVQPTAGTRDLTSSKHRLHGLSRLISRYCWRYERCGLAWWNVSFISEVNIINAISPLLQLGRPLMCVGFVKVFVKNGFFRYHIQLRVHGALYIYVRATIIYRSSI